MTTAAYADVKPTIDGVIEDGEWDSASSVNMSKFEIEIPGYDGEDDLSCTKMYYEWDEDNFYIGAEIKDNMQGYEIGQERIWAGDSIQFAMSSKKSQNAARTEIGFGLDKNMQPAVERYYYMGADAVVNFDGYDVKINRDEETKTTVYEACFPWRLILSGDSTISVDMPLYLSVLINDNDTGTRRGWIMCGGGIAPAKNPALFNEMHLLQRKN